MRTTRVLAAAAVTLTLSVTACGKADQADQPDPNSTTIYYGETPTESAEKGDGSAPTLDYANTDKDSTFSIQKPDGTTFEVTVSTGKLRRAQEGLAVGPEMSYDRATQAVGEVDILGRGCDVDLGAISRDAVIPFRIRMTDMTPGSWSTEPDIQPTVYVGDEILDPRHKVAISHEAHLGRGYVCEDAGSLSVDAGLVGIHMQNDRSDTHGWLILKDYYSPANPNGDADKYKDVKLVFDTMDQTRPDGWNEFSGATGAFTIKKERDSIANDGSYYTSGAVMSLAEVAW